MGYPKYGTHPIKCVNRKCKWKGYETDLAKRPSTICGVASQQSVCPECGCDSYQFLTKKQAESFQGTSPA